MAIIFALVRSTTSTASGQRWAARPATRPNVHAPPIYKRPHSVSTSRGPQSLSSPHPHRPEHYQPVTAPDQPGTEENPALLVMTGDMIEDNSMASKQEADIHKSPHTGMTSMMSGQHSQPESTEIMTDDHPQHHHRPRPVMTQKPGPISETPLMSSEAASEEHPMPPVMTEDNAMMLSEELNNAPESNEAMIEEMSVHEEMISVHEFKEVLDEVVNDAVDKIVMKKAGIVGKLKTAKQNFIGHIGEATSRDPQQRCLTMEQCAAFAVMTGTFIPDPCPVCPCKCDENTFDEFGRGDCNSDVDGLGVWCFLESKSFCTDQRPSKKLDGRFWSRQACSLREEMRKFQEQ